MLNYKEKRTLLILSIISVALSLIACIPFGLAKISQFELVVKYIVLPLVIAVISIVCYSIKYRNYRPAYRFPTVSGYLPVLSYSVALAINTLVVLLRSNQVFTLNQWAGLVVILSFYVIGSIALIHLFLEKIVVFTKNEIMVIDSLFIAVLAIDAIIFGVIANKFVGLSEPFANASSVFIVVPFVIAAAWGIFHIYHIVRLFKSDAELVLENKADVLAKYYKAHADFYSEAQGVILNALHDFTGEKLEDLNGEQEESVEEELVQEEVLEVEETQENACEVENLNEIVAQLEEEAEEEQQEVEVEKEVVVVKDEADAKRIAELEEALEKLHAEKNELHETHSEHLENAKNEAENAKAEAEALKAAEAARLAEEVAEAERKAKVAAERAEAVAKAKKAIKPSFQKLVSYASELEKDGSVVVVGNDKENQYKFYYNKKLFLMLVDSNIDYRLTFLCERETAIDLIINHPGVVVKAKSPKGSNWYKLTNKGAFEEKELKQVIKESLKTYKKMEAEAAAEKERIKAEKAAAKKAEKAAAKAAQK